ncbi:hypothetical protein SDC9_33904 [bioreactor metagenome]|uniref:Uncharacterized protein n=1 Tax=bioreactor metagenome TaxID=1076179 RepID=A0A644V9J1_9ZZZZ
MNLTREQYIILENSYLRHFPTNIPEEILLDYKSVLEFKALIRHSKADKRILSHLLDIVIDKITTKKRFQKITFIKLIRWQCDNSFIDSDLSDKLFFVFKSLIAEVNDTILWSLSVIIKDIELSQENIDWLIEHYQDSEHIQNRLLRYPIPNKGITTWSDQCLKQKKLQNRISELIGLKLNFYPDFNYKNKTSLLWGIHYSKLQDKTKKELLIKHMTHENFEELIKICEKNEFVDVISQLYNDLGK